MTLQLRHKTVHSVFFLFWLICSLCLSLNAHGQNYYSRDNHTGVSTYRSSWDGAWPGLANGGNLINSSVIARGYFVHGLVVSNANASFSGASSSLVVEDTLRVHGTLTMYDASLLHIKPGGVLIVHGAYEQAANSSFINEGKAIFLNSWRALGNKGEYSNTGDLYVSGTFQSGGTGLSARSYSLLSGDNPVLYYFSRINVIKADCPELNSGTLSLSGSYHRIVRWEVSTDFFKSSPTFIEHTESTYRYTNIQETTSFRVYYEASPGVYQYADGATIVVLENAEGGEVSGPDEFCSGTVSGSLGLNNFLGEVARWETSEDGFETISATLNTNTESLAFSDLASTTSYRAVVTNGNCGEVYSKEFTITVHPVSEGGNIAGSTEVCFGENTGELILSGHTGEIIRWESSTDATFTTVNTLNIVSPTLTFEDLQATTYYRAVVKSGLCNEAFSESAVVQVSQLAGGELSGSQTVCQADNSGTISLQNHSGTILRWEMSTDNFEFDIREIEHTTSDLSFENIAATTYYRAVLGNQACGEEVSTVAIVSVDAAVVGGNLLVDENQVCADTNSGTIELQNYTGEIVRWESSTTNFLSDINPIDHTATSYSFENLTTTTYYRAVVQSGACGEAYSDTVTITVYQPAVAGTIDGGNIQVCAGENSGTLELSGYSGTIVQWESSSDNFEQEVVVLNHTASQLPFSNLNTTVSYRVLVNNGSCSGVYTEHATIQVDQPAQGGSVQGPAETLCAGENSGSLELLEYSGQIVRWEYTESTFGTANQSLNHTDPILPFRNLATTTTYRAVVQNGSCAEVYSDEFTITISPQSQGGVVAGSTEVCKGENSGELVLSGYTGEIIRWESSTDASFSSINTIASTATALTYENLQTTTYYRAVVKSGACSEAFSETAVVQVSQLAGGELSGSQTVCQGDNSGSLLLQNYNGTILRWEMSSNNFIADIRQIAHTTPELTFANLQEATYYRVIVVNEVCGEAISTPVRISTDAAVTGGELSASDYAVCADVNSGIIELSNYAGEIIRWERSTDQFQNSIHPINYTGASYFFENLEQTTYFRAIVQSGACGEAFSETLTVTVDQPAIGGALEGGEVTFCGAENNGELQLTAYAGTILQWERSSDNFENDVQVLESTGSRFAFSNLSATTSFRVLVGSGSCEAEYSSVTTITIEEPPVAGSLSGPAVVCSGENEGVLVLENAQGNIIRWERSTDGFVNHVEPYSHTQNSFSFAQLTESTSYRVVLGGGSCGELYTDALTVQVEAAAIGGTIAGSRRVIPGENAGELELQDYDGNIIQWEVSTDNFSQDIRIINETNTTYTYHNIAEDTYFRVQIAKNNCPPVYSAVAELRINQAPVALNDHFTVYTGEEFVSTVSLLDNDYDPDGDRLVFGTETTYTTLAGNFLTVDAGGYITFNPSAGFMGADSLEYHICDDAGEASRYTSAYVILEVLEREPADVQIVIYQGVSPNGDGKNDTWIIEHIDKFTENLVQIFDRYGVLVYEQAGYDNSARVFAGLRNRGMATGSDELPESTYYYRIRISESQEAFRGYVILSR